MQTPLHAGADRQASITISAASIAPFVVAMLQPRAPLSLDQIKEALARIWAEIEQQVKQVLSSFDTMVANVCADLAALFTELEAE